MSDPPRPPSAEQLAAVEKTTLRLRRKVADLEALLQTARAEVLALKASRDAALKIATWGGRRVDSPSGARHPSPSAPAER